MMIISRTKLFHQLNIRNVCFLFVLFCAFPFKSSVWCQKITISKELISAIRPITIEEEVEMGREVAANIIAQFGLVQNDPLTDYVNLVGLTVAQSSSKEGLTYRFAILDSDIINAFAAPGGYIFITKGLLNLLGDESQLASVLAHEIAHVSQRHVVKEIQKSKIAQAAIPSYVKASAKESKWMNQITELAVQMVWKGLSREDELESDRLGLEYAKIAGYDVRSFKEVLEIIQLRSKGSESGSRELKFLLSTHPKPEERIRIVSEKLNTLSPSGQRVSERFQKMVISQK